MSNVIPFPEREPKNIEMTVETSFDVMAECSKMIHVFDSVPGNCKCGKNFWDPPNEPVPLPGIMGA